MKTFYQMAAVATMAAFTLTSCDPTTTPVDPNPGDNMTKIITENITVNETWYADTTYQLGGRITVTAGATLTIEPGTVIKGEAGTGANAGFIDCAWWKIDGRWYSLDAYHLHYGCR